jgi:hypothetical protein
MDSPELKEITFESKPGGILEYPVYGSDWRIMRTGIFPANFLR